jgi:hypothetical protein
MRGRQGQCPFTKEQIAVAGFSAAAFFLGTLEMMWLVPDNADKTAGGFLLSRQRSDLFVLKT